MTITKSLMNVGADTALKLSDATNQWEPLDEDNLILVDTAVVANGGREAVYSLITSDQAHPLDVRVGYYPSKDGKMANVSVKLTTFTVMTSSLDATYEEFVPSSVTLAWSLPFPGVPTDATQLLNAIMNVVSVVIPLAAGVFSEANFGYLAYGVVNQMNATANSGAA